MILETERLLLRELTDSDFGALYRVLADSDSMKHYPYTFDDVRVKNWIEKNKIRYRDLGFGLWAVVLKETGEMIGDCGLTMQNIHGQIRPEIGYHIRADHQRKGYATEAARAVRDWTFANTPFEKIYSYMNSDNEASRKTAMAYGCEFYETYVDSEGNSTAVYRLGKKS